MERHLGCLYSNSCGNNKGGLFLPFIRRVIRRMIRRVIRYSGCPRENDAQPPHSLSQPSYRR